MIQCKNLVKEFRLKSAKSFLHWSIKELSIEDKERVLISGPSGCGKTTFLNLISGLSTPDSGEISVNGVHLESLSTSEMDIFRGKNIGLAFQSFQLIQPLTVKENILIGARYGRKWPAHDAQKRADLLISKVGMAERSNHHPDELSLGEQQRVAIARALINEPSILLADEPTASLDAANSKRVLDLLFDLCDAEGTTLVLVSHDRSISSRFDRVIDAEGWMKQSSMEGSHE